jgi:choline dehydrogenase-like flavoprotein
MDHPSTAFIGGVLEGLKRPSQAEGLQGPHGILIPRFRNLNGQRAGFLGGYGIWGGAQRFDTARGFPTLAKHWAIGTPGLVWRRVRRSPVRSARRLLGNERQSRDDAIVALRAYGEMIPRYENRVALSAETKDAWGIPVARIECAWSDNELAMTRDMSRSILEIMDAVGVRVTLNRVQAEAGTPLTPGLFAHELGGARMGADPRTSIVNPSNQLWDSPNVLVTDGACWPSGAWQNPTLTIMALTARACALIAKDPLP